MVITLIAGILLTVLLAILIMKFVPLKIQWLVSIVLLGAAAFLGYSIYDSIMAPINFNKVKKVKYAKVIENLRMIRDAQDAHKAITGKFEKDGKKLIKFLDTAQFVITDTKNVVKEVNRGTEWQPLMVEVEERVIDTVGYESVKETMYIGKDYSQMLNVPGTNAKFKITVSTIEKIAGLKLDVFIAEIDKAVVLEGLDEHLIDQERQAIGGDEVKGAVLSVGSLTEVNSNGNWPPFYDQKVEK